MKTQSLLPKELTKETLKGRTWLRKQWYTKTLVICGQNTTLIVYNNYTDCNVIKKNGNNWPKTWSE